jgi:hypothetical protein
LGVSLTCFRRHLRACMCISCHAMCKLAHVLALRCAVGKVSVVRPSHRSFNLPACLRGERYKPTRILYTCRSVPYHEAEVLGGIAISTRLPAALCGTWTGRKHRGFNFGLGRILELRIIGIQVGLCFDWSSVRCSNSWRLLAMLRGGRAGWRSFRVSLAVR